MTYKNLQITIYSLICVFTVGIRRSDSRHSWGRLCGLCVGNLFSEPINTDRGKKRRSIKAFVYRL